MMQKSGGSITVGRGRGRPAGADSAVTRAAILRAARRVINQRGYGSATFQAIAAEAGLSRPTLHYYFANREEVYDTLVDEARAVISACVRTALEHRTLRGRLEAFMAAVRDADFEDRSRIAFIVTARLESRRHPGLNNGAVRELRAFLALIVTDAVMDGELPLDTDVAPVVEMLHAMMWGLGFYAGFIDSAADMAAIAKQLMSLLSRGLLNGPAGVA
jgi:AcrR family transcriptional regulator